MATDTQDMKEKVFEHTFTIAGASIPVRASGSEVVFSPEIQTSSYLHHTQKACREWLMELGKGGSAIMQDGKIRVNLPNHTFTEEEIKGMESHFQPLETHPDRPHKEEPEKIMESGTQPKPPASETRAAGKR